MRLFLSRWAICLGAIAFQRAKRIYYGPGDTTYALGLVEETPSLHKWDNVFVMLANRDRLVALAPTLDLLEGMGLTSQSIQVVLGDHYFFSVSQGSRRLHAFNRAEVLRHILRLHNGRRTENK